MNEKEEKESVEREWDGRKKARSKRKERLERKRRR